MRTLDVADVGHRLASELRRTGHSPARHDKLALAVSSGTHDWRKLVRIDGREERKIARAIMLRGEEVADGRLPLGQAVEVAHAIDYAALGVISKGVGNAGLAAPPSREDSMDRG